MLSQHKRCCFHYRGFEGRGAARARKDNSVLFLRLTWQEKCARSNEEKPVELSSPVSGVGPDVCGPSPTLQHHLPHNRICSFIFKHVISQQRDVRASRAATTVRLLYVQGSGGLDHIRTASNLASDSVCTCYGDNNTHFLQSRSEACSWSSVTPYP